MLCFQKSNVFVNCGSADVADPCQFADIQLLTLVGEIVAKEGGGDVLFAHLRSPDLSPLGSGIFHARPHSCPNHRQFQLAEHTCHLEKCFAHGVNMTITAIQRDTAHNHKPKMLSQTASASYSFGRSTLASSSILDIVLFSFWCLLK